MNINKKVPPVPDSIAVLVTAIATWAEHDMNFSRASSLALKQRLIESWLTFYEGPHAPDRPAPLP
ncbi:hypothetical protein IAE60_10315 [Pseudoxanthomonas mexicana]|uniref:Uncharacterized protein n=1 Tax=Pseudoxanthomonas mexicana TaxID=128785 RepID=A0A7G9T8D3_PSEMX|nr:hypothetical protein [Pseudoxanthomonas mexicana]QNN76358.1 hypothetical protein IAE60_10315 [Pseudoxanthomonas mexicana]